MADPLHGRLGPVRYRQRLVYLLRAVGVGLLAGSLVAVVLASGRFVDYELPTAAVLLVAGGGALLGGLFGLVFAPTWQAAAAAVDRHYRLKDRSTTALEFVDTGQGDEVRGLQIADALSHLQDVDVPQVVPVTLPRCLSLGLVTLAGVLALLLVPIAGDTVAAKSVTPPQILAEADRLEELLLAELDRLQEDADEEELLDELRVELEEMIDELREPGVDEREALAKLSEMQAVVAAAQAEFNMDTVDANMQSLGEAMSAAQAMQSTAAALKEGDYDKAAEKLEQLDSQKLTRKEAKAVSKNLKQLAKKLGEAGQGKLSESMSEFADSLEAGDPGNCKECQNKMARFCRKCALRKRAGECLGCQLNLLAECKGNCSGKKNGGKNASKSNSPKNTWGRGTTGNPFGEEGTSLDSRRNMEQISGTGGDGPSEREVSHAPEGEQNAVRGYRESYEKYRKRSEEVIQSEALPLGHRQIIREYFEAIRPDRSTDPTVETADSDTE